MTALATAVEPRAERYSPRTLATVLAELMLAQGELDRLMNRTDGKSLTELQDRRWAQLEDIISARREEAKEIIRAATGVDWDQIEGVLS